MKKRLLALALALVMALALLPTAAVATYDIRYEFTLRDRAAYYFGIGDMDAYNKTMKELEEYLADNADQKNETTVPTTKPETPEIPELSEMPTFRHYTDVPNDAWYAEAVNAMTEGGLLKGYDDGLFHPNDIITAGQFATIICRIGGEDPNNSNFKPHRENGILIEKPTHWASHAIYLTHLGYYYAFPSDRADWYVLRGEAFETLVNVASRIPEYCDTDKQFKQVSEKTWTINDIPDVDETLIIGFDLNRSKWELNDGMCASGMDFGRIVEAYNLGITHGIDSLGTCDPLKPVTRAELCQMLYNMGIVRESCVSMWGNTAHLYESQINPGPRQTTAD